MQAADEAAEREKLAALIEDHIPANDKSIKTASVGEVAVPASAPATTPAPTPAAAAAPNPVTSAWVIQLGATDDEEKAKDILDRAGKLRAVMPYGHPADDFVHDLKILLRG